MKSPYSQRGKRTRGTRRENGDGDGSGVGPNPPAGDTVVDGSGNQVVDGSGNRVVP